MGKSLETLRKNLLLHLGDRSQRWLAKESDVNQGSLSQILSGDGNPSIDTVERLAKALKTTPAVLLGGTDGVQYNIPKDILEMLSDENEIVYDTIRIILKTVNSERKKKD